MAKGAIIRYDLTVEAVFTTLMAAGLIMFPKLSLSLLLPTSTAAKALSTNELFFMLGPFIGVCLLMQAVLMGFGIPDRNAAFRPYVFWTILSSELAFIPLLYWFATSSAVGGWTYTGSIPLMAWLVGPATWRLFVLLVKPSLFGDVATTARKAQ